LPLAAAFVCAPTALPQEHNKKTRKGNVAGAQTYSAAQAKRPYFFRPETATPVNPATVAITPPTISMIALLVADPVNTRETSLLTELNAWPPKYNSTIPPTINAIEIAFVMIPPINPIGEV